LGGFVVRGERLIKLGNSWFSAKFIEVKRYIIIMRVEHATYLGRVKPLLKVLKLRIFIKLSIIDRI